jgi:regulator of protease activity HflC (stomatin/prohibitin superfamily)
VVFNDWTEKLYEFPTFQQHIDYSVQTVITKGGFNADIKPSFNYALVSTAVGDMFQNLRLPIKEVEQGWLKTAIVGSVNDVANKWAVDSIFNHRELFESSIIIECNKRISKWFTVSQLRTNITPPPSLQSAIEAKTKALQEVQVAENQKQVAVAEAYRKIAIARGDSARMVIEASGEAEAIKRKQLTLSNMYIEYLKIQKWDGKNPTTVLGKEGSTIISVK